MRKTVYGVCFLISGAGAAVALPMDLTVDRLLDICEARTVEAASAMGDELGWQRLEDPKWRTSFVAYNGGSVEVVSWRRELTGGTDETLSFWVAVGPNAHTACAYSTMDPDGVLSAMSERLGKPDSLDANGAIEMVSAWWTQAERQYSFTQVGSSATVNIGPNF